MLTPLLALRFAGCKDGDGVRWALVGCRRLEVDFQTGQLGNDARWTLQTQAALAPHLAFETLYFPATAAMRHQGRGHDGKQPGTRLR